MTTKPDITNFTDLREYLKEIYAWRKAAKPDFSYAMWANEMGIKSRSFLRLLVVGQRSLTERLIPTFIQSLELKKLEATHFEHLVRFANAKTHAARERQWAELKNLKPAHKGSEKSRIFVQDRHEFASSPLLARIQTLLADPDLQKDKVSIAHALHSTAAKTQAALETLERLNMAHRQGETWAVNAQEFLVDDELGSFALQSFHKKSLLEAVDAIDLSPTLRRFQSLLVMASPQEFEEMQPRIRAFLEELLEQYEGKRGPSRRLYQLNINLIPVSEPILQREKPHAAPLGQSSPNLQEVELNYEN